MGGKKGRFNKKKKENMEEQRVLHKRLLTARFRAVQCHSDERLAHVAFLGDGVAPEASVWQLMSSDQIVERFDASSDLVRWLLNQVATFNPDTQAVVASAFDDRCVVSDVLWLRRRA